MQYLYNQRHCVNWQNPLKDLFQYPSCDNFILNIKTPSAARTLPMFYKHDFAFVYANFQQFKV